MSIRDLKAFPGFKPGNKRYEANVRAPNGDQLRRRFKLKKEAEAFIEETMRQGRAGVTVDTRSAKSKRVAELWAEFFEHVKKHGVRGNHPAKQKTLDDYAYNWDNYLRHHWEHTTLSNVSRERCREWVNGMTNKADRPASAYAVNRAANVMRRLMDYALDQSLVSFNPMTTPSGKPLPTPAHSDQRANVFLTPRQLGRLAHLIDPRYSLMVWTAGTTGLRFGELAGLQVQDVTTGTAPSVFVPVSRSKTGAPRSVPLATQIAEAMTSAGLLTRDSDALVFTGKRGGRLNDSNFREREYSPAASLLTTCISSLQSALNVSETTSHPHGGETVTVAQYGERTASAVQDYQRAHGMDPTGSTSSELWESLGLDRYAPVTLRLPTDGGPLDTDPNGVPTIHDLRHTAVSLAIQAGLNVKLVQQIAGHKSASVTLDVYSHLYPEDVGTAGTAMGDVLRAGLHGGPL